MLRRSRSQLSTHSPPFPITQRHALRANKRQQMATPGAPSMPTTCFAVPYGKQSHGGHLKAFSTIKSSIWRSPETWSWSRAWKRAVNLWVFTTLLHEDCRNCVLFRLEVPANGLLRKHDAMMSANVSAYVHVWYVCIADAQKVFLTGRADDREKESGREGAGGCCSSWVVCFPLWENSIFTFCN